METPDRNQDENMKIPHLGETAPGACEWIMEQVAEERAQEPECINPFIPVPRGLTQGKSRIMRETLETRGVPFVDFPVSRDGG